MRLLLLVRVHNATFSTFFVSYLFWYDIICYCHSNVWWSDRDLIAILLKSYLMEFNLCNESCFTHMHCWQTASIISIIFHLVILSSSRKNGAFLRLCCDCTMSGSSAAKLSVNDVSAKESTWYTRLAEARSCVLS